MFMTSVQVFLFHGNLPALSGLSLLLFSRAVSSRDQLRGKQTWDTKKAAKHDLSFGAMLGTNSHKERSWKKALVWTAPVAGFCWCLSGLISKPATWQIISLDHCYSSSRAAHSGSTVLWREPLSPASADSVFLLKWEQSSHGLWQLTSS